MGKKEKEVHDKFGKTEIILPPDQFIYEEDDIILLGYELVPGGSGRTTPLIISKTQFSPDSLKNIRTWLEKYDQDDDILANRVQALAGVISINGEKRQKLFSKFRNIQIAKLDKYIEAIKTAMHLIWSDGLYLSEPYGLLQDQKKIYEVYRRQLRSQRKDVHKLLYRELYPVLCRFDDLGIKMADQHRMLRELFKLFEYEDFKLEVKDTSMIKRAKKINYDTRKWFSSQ